MESLSRSAESSWILPDLFVVPLPEKDGAATWYCRVAFFGFTQVLQIKSRSARGDRAERCWHLPAQRQGDGERRA